MKNIFKFSTLLALSAFFGAVACMPDELSTDQFSDDGTVVFSAFAPNPIVRGAELRIMGSNLDKVVEVQVPGSEPITEIKVVSSGRVSEIRVTVPVAGAEEESVSGPVVIVDNSGRSYASMTDITFTEGIVFESFEPASAMSGDTITVKGDYLYSVQQIVLADGVYANGDMIVEKSRRELKFIVPSAAITGTFAIGDVDEQNNTDGAIPNNVVSTETLTIGDPTVTAAARGALKAGQTVTVTGAHLDMIESLNFGGVEAEFTVAEDSTSITTALPATAVEGDLLLVSYAGKEFNAGAYTTIIPTEVTIAAETRYKAGLNAVISGKDLDLVTGAALAETALTTTYDDKEGSLTFAIPATAVDGTVVLSLANGKTVETSAIELVKPTITGVTPASLYAGESPITVTGTDLDLVVSATLGGRAVSIAEGATATSMTLNTDATSVSGKVALTLANGVTVESEAEVTVNYHSLVIVSEMPTAQHIGQEVVIKGEKLSLVENIFIGEEKVTQYSLRTDEEIRFLMPWNKVGMYDISFHLFNGDIETQATQIEVQLELDINTIWEGSASVGEWGGDQSLGWGNYDWSQVEPGTVLTAYVTLDETYDWWQLRFGQAGNNWNSIPSGVVLAGNEGGNIALSAGATYCAVTLTAADIDALANNKGLVLTGAHYTVTRVTLTTEIAQEVTVWEGDQDLVSWGSLEVKPADLLINAGLQVGSVLNFYLSVLNESDWAFQVFDGMWNGVIHSDLGNNPSSSNGTDLSSGVFTYTVDDALYEALTTHQDWGNSIIFQGNNVKITKMTIL